MEIKDYPLNCNLIGTTPEDGYIQVYISEITLNKIKEYLFSDCLKELGGVLIGKIYKNPVGKEYIRINNYIIAEDTEADLLKLTFTHKTWEKINNKLEKDFNDENIVGWFHSHPGHGIFLSRYDEFIHNNFFSNSNGIAYVYDPIKNEEGFFVNVDNEPQKLSGYYVFTDETSSIIVEPEKIELKNSDEKKSNNKYIKLIIFLIVIFNLSIFVYLLFLFSDINSKVETLNLYLKNNEKQISMIKNELDERKNNLDYNQKTFPYKVKDGESLRKISLMFYNDTSKVTYLIKQNNLRDEYDVKTGQIILIPVLND